MTAKEPLCINRSDWRGEGLSYGTINPGPTRTHGIRARLRPKIPQVCLVLPHTPIFVVKMRVPLALQLLVLFAILAAVDACSNLGKYPPFVTNSSIEPTTAQPTAIARPAGVKYRYARTMCPDGY